MMNQPTILSGKFHAGSDLWCGENVVVDVAEEVIIGDRCVLPDNAYFGGRRITIGDDFYGYSWEHPGFPRRETPDTTCLGPPVGRWLEIGRGRIDEEDAILIVGSRCTFHDNRIDLSRRVTVGNDVGLSPEVAIYTHGYWQPVTWGFPATYAPVTIKDWVIVGFRSVLLAGAGIGEETTIGAQSVVAGEIPGGGIYAGNPARLIRTPKPLTLEQKRDVVSSALVDYGRSAHYRKLRMRVAEDFEYPTLKMFGCGFDFETFSVTGPEDEYTDDLRDFLFRRGLRFYTKRPFRKLPRDYAR